MPVSTGTLGWPIWESWKTFSWAAQNVPPFTQATASHRLYPWGPSLWLPAAPRSPLRLPAAPQLVPPPRKTVSGLTRAVRKRWKPSCPSHSPCRDAGLRPDPQTTVSAEHPPAKDLPPPPRRQAAVPHQVPGQPARGSPQLSGAGRRAGFAAGGRVAGLTPLQVRRAAVPPWDAGATQRVGAAGPTQLSRRNAPVPAKVGPTPSGNQPGVHGSVTGKSWQGRGAAQPCHGASDSLVVACKDRRARREGKGDEGWGVLCTAAAVMCHLVLALGQRQIQLCCYCCHAETFTSSNGQGETCGSHPPQRLYNRPEGKKVHRPAGSGRNLLMLCLVRGSRQYSVTVHR